MWTSGTFDQNRIKLFNSPVPERVLKYK